MKRIAVWLKHYGISLLIVLLLVLLGIQQVRQERAVKGLAQNVHDLEWKFAVAEHRAGTNQLSAKIGVIQFLKRGYSITLESVEYDQAGLRLVGKIGNPSNLSLSALTLTFTAYPRLDSVTEKDTLYFWLRKDIGTGQAQVGNVGPGTDAPFGVTIPNVKQTSQGYDLEVAFSGERYSYAR